MHDDSRLDAKLVDLARELVMRPVVPGFAIADAFTMRGVDETGKPGVFAAILLAPQPTPELGTLTTFRQVLAQKLKQLNTTIPAWPIVVQGVPEVIDAQNTVPGGREYFEQVKSELLARRERLRERANATLFVEPLEVEAPAKKAKGKVVKASAKVKRAPARASRSVKRASAKTARSRR